LWTQHFEERRKMSEDQSRQQLRPEMSLKSVGWVRSAVKEPMLRADGRSLELREALEVARRRARSIRETVSEIEVYPGMADLLSGIEDFSHLLVLYWAHLVPEEGRSLLKVHPIGRREFPLTGVFATCSPARPNPVLVNAVRLLERRENVLRVSGLEAVDGTPLVDIKPYVPMYFRVEDARLSDWMNQIIREFAEE
jgi:tRNA-Thr(GGU) m(6)t(6)A37 methyltransferase TsaA